MHSADRSWGSQLLLPSSAQPLNPGVKVVAGGSTVGGGGAKERRRAAHTEYYHEACFDPALHPFRNPVVTTSPEQKD